MGTYSLFAKVLYVMKRHFVAISLVVVGLMSLVFLGNTLSVHDTLDLVFGGIFRVGLGVSAILLVLKFAFPKLHIQERIQYDAQAIAIFAAGVAIAIALLF